MNETTTVHLRIIQGHELIVDMPEWPYPVPRVGDYIFHPPYGPGDPANIAGCVKTVTWRTHDRSGDRSKFVMTDEPYIELAI